MELLAPAARRPLQDFGFLTPIQRLSIPVVMKGTSALLIAPTAAGKTEAALVPLLHLAETEHWMGAPQILWVAPTRALVNDLYRRVSESVAGHLTVGRRTGEHHEDSADLVVTTPESLDSVLVRGTDAAGNRWRQVRAVVMDELHLLAEGPRGTQLNILLRRLETVTGRALVRVALSATVADADGLAQRFLGPRGQVLIAGGGRALVVHRRVEGPLPTKPTGEPDPLAEQLWSSSGEPAKTRSLGELLIDLRASDRLKALVFVRSRAACDGVAARLAGYLSGRSPVVVVAHHGSLSKQTRERAERILTHSDESVAVATSTLEIGIDVGDITTVVLVDPPGSVSSLLQRIGRANRRGGAVHLLPLATSAPSAYIMASMLRAAVAGELDAVSRVLHYSVALQQVASSLKGAQNNRLPMAHLVSVLASEFPGPASVLQGLAEGGWITIRPDGLVAPTDAIGQIMDNPMRLHANIGNAGEIPVVDAVTGDPIAWVPRQAVAARIVIGGKAYKARRGDNEIRVREGAPVGSEEGVRYAARKMPLTRAALRHLAIGLGLPDAALVRTGGVWIHFGGALYAALLSACGIGGTGYASAIDPRRLALDQLTDKVSRNWAQFEGLLGFGPYQRLLPDALRQQSVVESCPIQEFAAWIMALQEGKPTERQLGVLIGVH